MMYITSWTAQGNKKIYQVNAINGSDWADPVELGTQINIKGFNSQQPFVTKDGST